MSYSECNLLKGGGLFRGLYLQATTLGVIKWDTRSLDYGSRWELCFGPKNIRMFLHVYIYMATSTQLYDLKP